VIPKRLSCTLNYIHGALTRAHCFMMFVVRFPI